MLKSKHLGRKPFGRNFVYRIKKKNRFQHQEHANYSRTY